jgi:hypothetical protein
MYCYSITVVVMLLTFCWCVGFSLVLCVAVLNVSCRWFYFCIRGRVCVLLTSVLFQHVLNTGLYVSMFVSFMCKLFILIFICGIFLMCLRVFLLPVFL